MSKRPFYRRDPSTGETVFMVPQLVNGMNRKPVVETSEDLTTWEVVRDARWGPLEEVGFRREDDGSHLTYFHPVTIPNRGASPEKQRFYRWGVRD